MLSTLEKVLFLRGVALFGALEDEDLVPVARIAREIAIPAGERFIVQGAIGDCLYLLVDGEASIMLDGAGELAKRGPHSIIGEMAIISRLPRTAHCIALTRPDRSADHARGLLGSAGPLPAPRARDDHGPCRASGGSRREPRKERRPRDDEGGSRHAGTPAGPVRHGPTAPVRAAGGRPRAPMSRGIGRLARAMRWIGDLDSLGRWSLV